MSSAHGGFSGKSKPLLNRGPRRRGDAYNELKTSLSSNSLSLYDGSPDPKAWRTTKAMEARLTTKKVHSKVHSKATVTEASWRGAY